MPDLITLIVVSVTVLIGIGTTLLISSRRPATKGDTETAIELARLREREGLLSGQVAKANQETTQLRGDLARRENELGDLREKSAANDERISALERELAREKELTASTQATLSTALEGVTDAKEHLQRALSEMSQKLSSAETLETELRGQLSRAGNHISDRDDTITNLRSELDDVRSKLSSKESDLAASAERETAHLRTISERDGLQKQVTTEFENIANRILSAATGQLSERSKESLGNILEPFKAQIAAFKDRVESTHIEDTKQRSALENEIKNIAQASQTIGKQAQNLTQALKGDAQLRGRWGEIRLERVLEMSGLQRDREFVVQGGDFNIKSEDGGSQRPDIIILLPENRHFVVDSKISLTDYLEYESAETEELRLVPLKKLLKSVRAHMDGLAAKNYQHAGAINSHDLVFMYVPIEGVAALVLRTDQDMFHYGWSRRIVMVSPSTLFAVMQTVASIWRYERQSQNAQAIAEQAGLLYDKLAGAVGDLNDVSHKIQAAADAHGEAMKKLSTGKGNALLRAQRLKSLGVNSRKQLPAILFDGESHSVGLDEEDGRLEYVAKDAQVLVPINGHQ